MIFGQFCCQKKKKLRFWFCIILNDLHFKRVWYKVVIRLFKQLYNNFRGSESYKFRMGFQRKVFAVEKNWDYGVHSQDYLGSKSNKECLIRIRSHRLAYSFIQFFFFFTLICIRACFLIINQGGVGTPIPDIVKGVGTTRVSLQPLRFMIDHLIYAV